MGTMTNCTRDLQLFVFIRFRFSSFQLYDCMEYQNRVER